MNSKKAERSQLLARVPKELKQEYLELCGMMGVSMSGDLASTIRRRVKEMRREFDD